MYNKHARQFRSQFRSWFRSALSLSSIVTAGLMLSHVVHAELPSNGMTQEAVSAEYGEPNDKTLPIGQPPISKWIYADYTVVFEYDRVIHSHPRLEKVEDRSIDQIPERPDFVNLIDQSVNKPSTAGGLIQRNASPQAPKLDAKQQIQKANQAIDTIQ